MIDDAAIDELIRHAVDPAASPESLVAPVNAVFATLSPNDRAAAEAVIGRLAEEVIDAPTRPDVAGRIALVCGALIERGLNPEIAIGPILNRIELQVAPEAVAFVAACREAAKDNPAAGATDEPAQDGEGKEQVDPIEQYGEQITAIMPSEASCFQALEPFSMAAVAMLARSIEARKATWSRTSLRRSLDELGGQYGHAGFLWTMMQVLDDEPIVVLHPAQGKGYRVRISGLGDNFQLHTLLADTLIGRFFDRWLRGRRPDRAEVEAARNGPIREDGPPSRGSFNLWTWRGLKPDRTLRDAMSGSAHWIWNEGVPADIPPFEGTRVVLLGPPPYERSWTTGRKFPAMAGDLRVESVLTTDEQRDLLGRIAAAVPAD